MEYVLAAIAGHRQPSLRRERTFHRRLATDDVPHQPLRYYRSPREHIRTLSFSEIAGFLKVLGCIHGTHVQSKPPKDQEHLYRNRKGLYTINVQTICDAEGAITQLTSKWPGSTHDSFIWADCDLRRCFQRRQSPDGGSGYALEPWLLTPVRSPVGPANEQYNSAHTRMRQVIERTFGVLKRRFRCLHQSRGALQYSPLMCTKIRVACAMLHNMCVRHGIDFNFTDVWAGGPAFFGGSSREGWSTSEEGSEKEDPPKKAPILRRSGPPAKTVRIK
ncbi:hypothetical protein HPB51_029019 [Rhipicephalus microplus]|uniref:Putative nuclease HARBI1 n=1 Tax=Rhipicephalus microplus TaxID=6941 RepID=A0A9J6CVB3_RHIMP|nr:hypothetical protein HPB51_029019 [Rhipicephalus microplus]